MFPLGTVLLPGEVLPLHVFEPRYRAMTQTVLEGDGTFGIILIARGSEVGGGDQRVTIGTLANVVEAAAFPDGRYALLVEGRDRFAVHSWEPEDPFPAAIVDPRPSRGSRVGTESLVRVAGSVRRARALISELGASLGAWDGTIDTPDVEAGTWRLASLAPFGAFDRQTVLEIDDCTDRLGAIESLCEEIADDAARLLSEGREEGP